MGARGCAGVPRRIVGHRPSYASCARETAKRARPHPRAARLSTVIPYRLRCSSPARGSRPSATVTTGVSRQVAAGGDGVHATPVAAAPRRASQRSAVDRPNEPT